MADKKISQLTGATTPLAGTEVLPIVQSSTTKKVSVSDLTAGRGVSALSVTATNLKTSATTAGLDISGFTIQAAGTDTDIDVSLTPKGAGAGRLASTQTGKFIVTSSQNSGIANTVVSAHATDAASLQSCFGNNAVAQTSYSTNLTRIDTSKSAWGFHSLVLSAAFENQSYMRLSYVSAAGAQITALEADYVGNITASTGNLVLGTAGKGVTTSGATALGLGVNGAVDAVTIDASKNLLVGTASVGGKVSVLAISGVGQFIKVAEVNATIMEFRNAQDVGGSITIAAGGGTSYNSPSDERLKHDIVDAPDASDLIDAIKVRSFKWKVDDSEQRYGMIAQELLEVAPEAVSQLGGSDSMLGVDYSKLVPMLVKELQSVRARLAQLEGN